MKKRDSETGRELLKEKALKLLPINRFYDEPTPEQTLEQLNQLDEAELAKAHKLYNQRIQDLPKTHGGKHQEAQEAFQKLRQLQEEEPARLIVNWADLIQECVDLYEQAKDSAKILGAMEPVDGLERLYKWRTNAIESRELVEELKREQVKNRLNDTTKGDWSRQELDAACKDQALVVCHGATDLEIERTYQINADAQVYLIPTLLIGTGCWKQVEDHLRVDTTDMAQVQVTSVLYSSRKTLRKAFKAAQETRGKLVVGRNAAEGTTATVKA